VICRQLQTAFTPCQRSTLWCARARAVYRNFVVRSWWKPPPRYATGVVGGACSLGPTVAVVALWWPGSHFSSPQSLTPPLPLSHVWHPAALRRPCTLCRFSPSPPSPCHGPTGGVCGRRPGIGLLWRRCRQAVAVAPRVADAGVLAVTAAKGAAHDGNGGRWAVEKVRQEQGKLLVLDRNRCCGREGGCGGVQGGRHSGGGGSRVGCPGDRVPTPIAQHHYFQVRGGCWRPVGFADGWADFVDWWGALRHERWGTQSTTRGWVALLRSLRLAVALLYFLGV